MFSYGELIPFAIKNLLDGERFWLLRPEEAAASPAG
jgi:hypothetical protein